MCRHKCIITKIPRWHQQKICCCWSESSGKNTLVQHGKNHSNDTWTKGKKKDLVQLERNFIRKERGGLCWSLFRMASMYTPIQVLSHLIVSSVRHLFCLCGIVFGKQKTWSEGSKTKHLNTKWMFIFKTNKQTKALTDTVGAEEVQTTQHLFKTQVEVRLPPRQLSANDLF